MGIFKPSAAELESAARGLHLRADQLDREGKHGKAAVERGKATKIEARAASKRPAAA